MNNKFLVFGFIICMLINLSSAINGTIYMLGDEYYGRNFNANSTVSLTFTRGGYLPNTPYMPIIFYNNTFYYQHSGGVQAWSVVTNTTTWNGSGNGVGSYNIELRNDYIDVWGTNGLVRLDPNNGATLNSYSLVGYAPYFNCFGGWISRYFNYSNTIYHFVGEANKRDTFCVTGSPQRLSITAYNISGGNGVELLTTSERAYNPVGYPMYDSVNRFLYTQTVGQSLGVLYPYNDLNVYYFNTTKVKSIGTYGVQFARLDTPPILDTYNHYYIAASTGNETTIIKLPYNLPSQNDKSCWVNSTCGSAGDGYGMTCSKIGGIMGNVPCVTGADCSGGTPNCNYIDSLGAKRCTNDNSAGYCYPILNSICYIEIKPSNALRGIMYDYRTKDLFLTAINNNSVSIYNFNVNLCNWSSNKVFATVVGSYGTGVTTENAYPIMDSNNFYFTYTNSTNSIYNVVRRNDYNLVYQRSLTKDMYNSSLNGAVVVNTGNAITYDTIFGRTAVLVDINKYLKFSGINYTNCPSEDVYVADPMCFINATLDLTSHNWCDIDVDPTDIQPCTERLAAGISCNRDWQCTSGISQGYCDIDIGGSVCKQTDSFLSYNCSCGKMSWISPGEPAAGFWFYEIVHGLESSLFSPRSVETNLDAVIYDRTVNEYNITMDLNSYYRVIGIDNNAREFWKSDIIAGTAGTTSTTTSTTITSTTTTTTLVNNCALTAHFNVYPNILGTVLPGYGIENSSITQIFCPGVPAPSDQSMFSPFCQSLICAHGNMLRYYELTGTAGSCLKIQNCITNQYGQCSMCISYLNNATAYREVCVLGYCINLTAGKYCLPFVFLPFSHPVCITLNPDEATTSFAVPDEMIFSSNTLNYQETNKYVSVKQDSNNFNSRDIYYSIYMPLYNISNIMVHINVLDKDTSLPIYGAEIRTYNLQTLVNTFFTNINGSANFSVPKSAMFTVQVSKLGYYPDNLGQTIWQPGLTNAFDYTIPTIYLAPVESNITFNISGHVEDAVTNNGISNCMMTIDCYHYYSPITGYLGPAVKVTKYAFTSTLGNYIFLNSVWNGSDCSLYTKCSGYNNQQVNLNSINSNTVYNFSLSKLSVDRVNIGGYIYDKSSCTGIAPYFFCNPISGVSVFLESTDKKYSQSTTTDSNGYYSVLSFVQGNVSILITKTGYISQRDYKLVNTNINDWNFYISQQSAPTWLRGHCVEVDTNQDEHPVNCTIDVKTSGGNLVTSIKSSTTQIGYFSAQINSGYYKVAATYKGHTQEVSIDLKHDMTFDELVFRFSTSVARISLAASNLLDFVADLMIFGQVILFLIVLAIISILIQTIVDPGGGIISGRRRR